MCNFKINGANLYAYHEEQNKTNAKMNAARNMLRKLKAIPNLSILLDEERTNSGALVEHPRCQLLHLHDTYPETYPVPPTFKGTNYWTQPRRRNEKRCINIICYFQIGRKKLVTIGAANKWKKAVVQAAQNMLELLFTKKEGMKNTLVPSDRMKNPWTCHFCNIFMNGRKPFLSHLTGRLHIQRMTELKLNAEEENKILQLLAEEACKKNDEEKRNTNSNNSTQRACSQVRSNKNKRFHRHKNVVVSSLQNTEELEGITKNASSSKSEKSNIRQAA